MTSWKFQSLFSEVIGNGMLADLPHY